MKALVVVLLLCGVAHAQETQDTIPYRVKQGDTLGLIAAEHYGDRNKAIFIMVENRMKHPRPLKAGERLRIPMPRDIVTAPGDSFESLAGAYLGNPLRGSFLAEFNGRSDKERLPAGTLLRVPFTITHVAAATETLSSIAAAFFNDPKKGEMLKRYNFLDKTVLQKGESIVVPSYNVRATAAKLPPIDEESSSRKQAREDAMKRARTAIPNAWQAWRLGEMQRIEALLVGIDLDFLDTELAVEVELLRGLTHAAENKKEVAIAEFKSLLERKPDYVLRAFDHSSKILDLWELAGGKIE